MSFHQKLESSHYNAYYAITGAIRGTSKEKLYQKIVLESLQLRRWYRKLGMFYSSYLKKHRHMLQEILKIFNFLISSTTFIKVLSFHSQSLNRTT